MQKGNDLNLELEPRRLNSLFRIVQYLSSKLDLKTSSNSNGHSPSTTDENLFSAAWYCAMFSDKRPVIITGDYDIMKMFTMIPPILADGILGDYNGPFIEAFAKNRPELVFRSAQGDYKVIGFDYSQLSANGLPKIPGLLREVSQFWKKFQLCPQESPEPKLVRIEQDQSPVIPYEKPIASIIPNT